MDGPTRAWTHARSARCPRSSRSTFAVRDRRARGVRAPCRSGSGTPGAIPPGGRSAVRDRPTAAGARTCGPACPRRRRRRGLVGRCPRIVTRCGLNLEWVPARSGCAIGALLDVLRTVLRWRSTEDDDAGARGRCDGAPAPARVLDGSGAPRARGRQGDEASTDELGVHPAGGAAGGGRGGARQATRSAGHQPKCGPWRVASGAAAHLRLRRAPCSGATSPRCSGRRGNTTSTLVYGQVMPLVDPPTVARGSATGRRRLPDGHAPRSRSPAGDVVWVDQRRGVRWATSRTTANTWVIRAARASP
jgi:hypothetical protein